jgi:hypothetical protein
MVVLARIAGGTTPIVHTRVRVRVRVRTYPCR